MKEKNEEELYFEDYGLAIGLISYALDVDGKDLFRDLFKPHLFENYKRRLEEYATDSIEENIYEPAGYRLFGRYGLAILSLIDEFAFCNRKFNNSIIGTPAADKKYNAKVITGISESSDGNYLKKQAEETFLREKEKYPFICITKLKVSNILLELYGIDATRKIKSIIDFLSKEEHTKHTFNSIIVDCFDNDELTLITFSNSLCVLSSFNDKIRQITNQDLKLEIEEKKNMHAFTSCHTNLGYDVDFTFKDAKNSNPDFISIEEEYAKDIKIQLIWEVKPGHKKTFDDFINKCLDGIEKPNTSIVGGNTLPMTISIEEIGKLEEMCINEKEPVKEHVRKLKIFLVTPEMYSEVYKKDEMDNHLFTPHKRTQIVDLSQLETKLTQCKISKIVRDRILNVFKLYEDSVEEPLHAAYFPEMKGGLIEVETMLDSFLKGNEPISDIDDCLSKHIACMEEGFYNRFFQKEIRSNNLEYCGGVQQYLTSFDYAYKEIIRILLAEDYKKKPNVFTTVSGYESVSSTRNCLHLNINQITYPELFATTVWKEAANYYNPFKKNKYSRYPNDISAREFKQWYELFNDEQSFVRVNKLIQTKPYFNPSDDVYKKLCCLLNKDAMDYFVIDYFVYCFGFSCNYELFWHFQWKNALQISQFYNRNGKFEIDMFISLLLRLLVVALHSDKIINGMREPDENSVRTFLREQKNVPYDSALSEVWFRCFEKVQNCAETIYDRLFVPFLKYWCAAERQHIEKQIVENTKYLKEGLEDKLAKEKTIDGYNELVIHPRRRMIDVFKMVFREDRLVNYRNFEDTAVEKEWIKSGDYLICLLNAYLLSVKELDEESKKETPVIKSVPRNKDGIILLNKKTEAEAMTSEDSLIHNILNFPADPLGGIFIPSFANRKKYFKLRTNFYRTLWHFTMISRDSTK